MSTPEQVAAPAGTAYRYYALAVLTAVYLVNLLDRILMGLILEPIKREFALSDTQLGFLTGIAFGLFYAVLGLPIARWADRGNRVTITSLSIGLWGLTMMACLFVTNFVSLLAARVCAAVGEAGCMPPAYSLVGDYFAEAAERARALAIYMSGSALASIVGFIAGGWMIERYGWRWAFAAIGVLGVLLAAVVARTLVEPRQLNSTTAQSQRSPPTASLAQVLAVLWRGHSIRHLSLALILIYTLGLGLSPWYAAFMIRNHGINPAELGVWFALIFGGGGVAGAWLGGHLAGSLMRRNEQGQLRLSACSAALLVPAYVIALTASGKATSLAAIVPTALVFGLFLGPSFALLQRLVGDSMRATTMAVVMLLANLIGMGLGPQVIGLLSDLLAPKWGLDSLRYAMSIVSLIAIWAAYHFWQAGREIHTDLTARHV